MTVQGEGVALAHAISRLFGWIYMLSWSLSFYPQVILNYRRRSTSGLAIDFPTANVLGFLCYTVSNSLLFFSRTIRAQYAARHPLSPEPTVRANDVAFAAHGFLLCLVTYSQFWPKFWGFKPQREAARHASLTVRSICMAGILGVLGVAVMVASQGNDAVEGRTRGWAWLDVVYALGYVKLVTTLIKFAPQAWFNYRRRSTRGWSIMQILLDFVGGVLSIAQLVIDASLQGDWSGLWGNPAKLFLGNVSLFFDVIFMSQHYILYGPATVKDLVGEDHEEQDESERGEEREAQERLLDADGLHESQRYGTV